MAIDGETKIPKAKAPKAWLSGHCNSANPLAVHRQCHGSYDGRPCKCSHHAVEKLLAHVHGIRASADATLAFPLDDLIVDDAARVLHETQMARKALQAFEEFLIERVHDAWGQDFKTPRVVEGVGVIRAFRGKDRKSWEHEALVRDVVDAHLAQLDGEIPDPFTVAGWIREAAGIGYWKTGALNALGLDADEFCESSPGRRTVSISTNDTIGGTQ